MAGGGRRRGGKGLGGGKSGELRTGDLVLAKVKGFPAWPAKISRPEDWDRVPDSKKYFVHFFGTQEIAFVAPADIQAFTSEVKDKLLARCQVKTVKYFAPAVEEICQAFEQLHHKDSSSLRDGNLEVLSADSDEDVLEDELKDSSTDDISRETEFKTSGDCGPGLERCAQRRDELDSRDTKSTNSSKADESSSPIKSPKRKKKKKKLPDDEANSLKEVVLALSCPKEDVSEDNETDATDVERDVRKDISLVKTSRSRDSDCGKKEQLNGQKVGQMTTLPKKKPKESHDVHNNGTSTVSSRPRGNSTNLNERLHEHAHNTIVRKKVTGSSVRESYRELKLDVDAASEKKKELRRQRESSDEDDLPPFKRRREASESLSNTAIKTEENRMGKFPVGKKNDKVHASAVKTPVTQLHTKRRAVRIYDDDDEERPKTPIHGRPASKVGASAGPSEERSHSVRVLNDHSALNSDQPLGKRVKKLIASPIPHSHAKPLERVPIKTDKHISGSPRKTSITGGATNKQVSEPKKADSLLVKVPGAVNQKKAQTGPLKSPDLVSNGLGYAQSVPKSEQSKTISSGKSRNVERVSNDGGIRNLIAAAKMKQAHSQNNFHDDAKTVLTPSGDMPRRSESPLSAVQHSLPESSNILPPDIEGHYANTINVSSQQDLPSDKQPDTDEFEETRVDTEAAVARDAFEGMIETLSRTRDSIWRATRLAIDCAKYGIANEVVELLIRKLETESDYHRKIDIFFLVDSITQGSHKEKGIAAASYIPTVQAALPRLIGAAAPRGAAAHENRRQCLKVLKLWLDRDILPESLLRRYIDGLGVTSDDASASFLLRRPSRAERAVDDPIREMEGMLVDEYGSNATFQLPGLLSAHIFEDDEDDEPGPSYAEPDIASPIEEPPVTLDFETVAVTPSDRTPCILEDVDGELEMEDVSGQPKDERNSCENGSPELFSKHQHPDEYMEVDSEDVSPLIGSPPLPHNSPPPTPPLPSSPPPPPSPSSPSAPPPPPSFLPLPQSLPVPHSGPQPSLLAQTSLPPPMISQQFHPSIPNVAPNISYQPPLTLENCSTPSGNQFAQMATSTTFRHNDLQVNPQVSQPNQQFQTRNPPFPQRPFHPIPPPLSQSSHYVYQNSSANQLPQHPYSRPYSSPNLHDGPRRYIADEQWRRSTNEFKTENSRGAWVGNGGTGAPYGREGYFSSPLRRPTMNKGGFQPATPVPGHASSPPLPIRPDMRAIDRWRPS